MCNKIHETWSSDVSDISRIASANNDKFYFVRCFSIWGYSGLKVNIFKWKYGNNSDEFSAGRKITWLFFLII